MSLPLLLLRERDVSPAVDLSFTDGALPDGTAFARASTGTYVDSSGVLQSAAINIPRFDFDPVSHAARGLLYEGERINASTYSDFNTWGDSLTTTLLNNALSPDGFIHAAKSSDNETLGAHYINKGSEASFVVGNVYTFSCYMKAGTATVAQLTMGSAPFGSVQCANFNLANGTLGSYLDVLPSITPAGNGWYRCAITATATATVSSASVGMIVFVNENLSAGRVPSYTGTGKNFYMFGNQNEYGANVSSFIPTSGASQTRVADLLSFTIPNGVSTLRYVFDDDSAQDASVSAGDYTVPANLNRCRIKRIYSVLA